MGFIEKFILPKEENFITALKEQTGVARSIVYDLYDACVNQKAEALDSVIDDADRMRSLKGTNMKMLLNVFLTPYDKESIYRLITQLDWVVLSIRHFVIEREVYGIESLDDYRNIFDVLKEMATLLEEGFDQLAAKEMVGLAATIDLIHDKYDQLVEYCARAMAELFKNDDCKTILMHKDIVAQLKEVAKRMHITATTVEDMAIKVV
jgi:uncharacterized protein Yka (UPF0111/DUF47 family)